jgi:uncharacterized protein Yka (UPF0111/DUF47 family)
MTPEDVRVVQDNDAKTQELTIKNLEEQMVALTTTITKRFRNLNDSCTSLSKGIEKLEVSLHGRLGELEEGTIKHHEKIESLEQKFDDIEQ